MQDRCGSTENPCNALPLACLALIDHVLGSLDRQSSSVPLIGFDLPGVILDSRKMVSSEVKEKQSDHWSRHQPTSLPSHGCHDMSKRNDARDGTHTSCTVVIFAVYEQASLAQYPINKCNGLNNARSRMPDGDEPAFAVSRDHIKQRSTRRGAQYDISHLLPVCHLEYVANICSGPPPISSHHHSDANDQAVSGLQYPSHCYMQEKKKRAIVRKPMPTTRQVPTLHTLQIIQRSAVSRQGPLGIHLDLSPRTA